MKYGVFLRIEKSHASREQRPPLRDSADAREKFAEWRKRWTPRTSHGPVGFGNFRRPLNYDSLRARKLRGFAA